MTAIPGYRRSQPGTQPPHLHPPYLSSIKRAPSQPLIYLPHTLSEITGPVFGPESCDVKASDLTRQHSGEPLGERIIVSGRVIDEDGRPLPQYARRSLASQLPPDATCTKKISTTRRSIPTSPAAATRITRFRRSLSLRHHSPRRISMDQQPQRLACRAHSLFGFRAGIRHAPGHADVFSRRSADGFRSHFQLHRRRATPATG